MLFGSFTYLYTIQALPHAKKSSWFLVGSYSITRTNSQSAVVYIYTAEYPLQNELNTNISNTISLSANKITTLIDSHTLVTVQYFLLINEILSGDDTSVGPLRFLHHTTPITTSATVAMTT